MKKIVILLALLQSVYCISDAKTVDENTAKTVGYTFLSKEGSAVSGIGDMQMVYEATTKVNGNVLPCFYVFNVNSTKGFVIVSGDDNVTPVLGYSTHNIFQAQNMRSNVAGWLDGYQKQISYVINNNIAAETGTSEKWSSLISGNMLTAARTTTVSPLLTTQWDQMPYYNDQCPYDASASQRTVTGCVATAMAQVMKYWNYPATGTGTHTYVDPNYGSQTADFGNASYGWSNMPAYITTTNTYIAKLMYQVGVSVDMQYGTAASGVGSGSYVTVAESPVINCTEYALKTYFGYRSSLQGLSRDDWYGNPIYTDAQWTTLLQTELDANRPVIYTGAGSAGGHCWVCDGYDNTGMFHLNWGWSGQSDGYFTINNLAPPALGVGGGGGNFNSDQTIVIGIQPPAATTPSTNTIKMDAYIINNTSSPANYGSPFSLSTQFINSGSSSFSGDFCALIYNDSDVFIDTLKMISGQNIAAGASSSVLLFNTTTGFYNMVSGLYHIRFYSRPEGGSWSLIADNTIGANHYINNAAMSICDQGSIFLVDKLSVTQNSITGVNLIYGNPVTVTTKMADYFSSTGFYGSIDASLYSVIDGSKVFTIKQLANQNISANSTGVSLTFAGSSLIVPIGTYVLKITDKANSQSSYETTCSAHDPNPILVTVSYPTGVEEVNNSSDGITLYPNPASDVVTINMNGIAATSIRVMDISGRQVTNVIDMTNQSSVTIPVRNMAPGMYFAQISTQQGVITKKIVVR